MRHCLPDPEAEKNTGSGYFSIFSCEFDSGKRAKGGGETIRIGEDGKIMLLLCESCLEQLRGQILRPIVVEALRQKSLQDEL
jgi:hypothetical protein